jgi:hypothetical protein
MGGTSVEVRKPVAVAPKMVLLAGNGTTPVVDAASAPIVPSAAGTAFAVTVGATDGDGEHSDDSGGEPPTGGTCVDQGGFLQTRRNRRCRWSDC